MTGPWIQPPPGPMSDWPLARPRWPGEPPIRNPLDPDTEPPGWPSKNAPADANWPIPAGTDVGQPDEFEFFHHGSNINPNITIDTSTTNTGGRSLQDIFDDAIGGGGGRFITGMPTFKGDRGDTEDLLRQAVTVPSLHEIPGYDRRCGSGHDCDFGEAWHVPGVPGSTRDKILARDLNDVTRLPNGKVTGGWENDPYTGKRLDGPDQIQIDHVFPLQRAWNMGAADWPKDQRIAFANDPDNLLAVGSQPNQDKGWSGPSEWLPPDKSEQLDYVERYLRVADKYHLPITEAEKKAIQDVINGAEGADMTGTPSLEEIQDWNPKHLDTMSSHLITVGDNNTMAMDKRASQAVGLPWNGAGKNGLDPVMAAHVGTAGRDATQMATTAGIAKEASETLSGSRQLLLESVDGAKGSQFDVGDDFTAKDLNQLRAKYMPNLAQGVTGDLQTGAQGFGSQRQAAATAITASLEDPGDYPSGPGWYDHQGNWFPTKAQAECSDEGPAYRGRNDCNAYSTSGFHIGGAGRGPQDFRTGGGPDNTPSAKTLGHLVSPDPNQHPGKKDRSFGDNFQSFTNVVGGALGVVGGTVLTGTSAAAEAVTDGVSTPISVPGVLGGLGMVAAGSGAIEKGLNDLFGNK